MKESGQRLAEALKLLPKVELHVHLDGMLSAELVFNSAKRRGLRMPDNIQNVHDLIPYTSLPKSCTSLTECLQVFDFLLPFVRGDPIAIRQLVKDAYQYLLDNNIIYAEFRFCPQLFRDEQMSARDVLDLVCTTMAEYLGPTPDREVRFLLCAIRDIPEWTGEIIDMAVEYRDRGVVGIDLAGDERHSCMSHADQFKRAHNLDLNITVHAGEAGTPEEVYKAIEFLHAVRIGHGYRIVQSEGVYDFVKRSGAHLECCLTSSIRTGAVVAAANSHEANHGRHPVKIFADDQLSFSLSTDDPAVFNSTLNEEYIYAHDSIGLDFNQICHSIENAINAAFLSDSERRVLHDKITEAIERIRLEFHL